MNWASQEQMQSSVVCPVAFGMIIITTINSTSIRICVVIIIVVIIIIMIIIIIISSTSRCARSPARARCSSSCRKLFVFYPTGSR